MDMSFCRFAVLLFVMFGWWSMAKTDIGVARNMVGTDIDMLYVCDMSLVLQGSLWPRFVVDAQCRHAM